MAILQSYSMFKGYEINTALRLSHFLGQGLIETGFLSAKVENLNYSFDALKRMWSHKFDGDEEMHAYARKPEKIANRIYADRMGNGPEASGEGWRYRGRGFFQLTGKNNYRLYAELSGLDLINDPEMLERDLKLSIQVAAAYMQKTGLLEFADRNDVAAVSRGVNRGDPHALLPAHGEAKRIEWTTKALALVKDPQSIVGAKPGAPPPAAPAPAPADTELKIGSTGEAVKKVQRLLHALGYSTGPDDGIYGAQTSRAVVNFQKEHNLGVTGTVDAATLAAMEAAANKPAAPAPAPAPGAPPSPQDPVDYDKPEPRPPQTPPKEKPVAQSRSIWGAIVAGIAGIAQFVQQQLSAIPDISTPWGTLSGGIVLVVVILLAVGFVIYARLDDRAKGKR
jgi:putative chitinase